ncbi:shTK domain protein [Necator americanus]|uniref:ShTK domain protein n=1 Tax=Necator americanus TaxID=51031 RepID=W2TBU3_NECAM|nr:shTK domain protein [Necator americanus]ETN79520.1 shTK domain protein [Necator americanus]
MIRWVVLFVAVATVLAEDSVRNVTCRAKTRSTEECKDFMEHCEILHCDHVDFVDFARANCAKTCNFCFENATLPPEYACTDLLDDCRDRSKLCRDIDFMDMMAVFCPRSCMLCAYQPPPGGCQELLNE